MRILAPLLLVVASIAAYFALALAFGIYQRVPWPHLLLAGGASVWALWQVARLKEARVRRSAVAALCLLLTGFYGWYTLSYSNYGRTTAIAAGERIAELPGLTLASHDGTEKAVLADRATLLVFYRGFW